MRKHNGMRPQDVVVLLKISTLATTPWQGKDLAAALFISPAEISDALRRCQYARLLHPDGRTVHQRALLTFLFYGLPFVFPAHPGGIVQGTPTAHSAVPAVQGEGSRLPYVWPNPDGKDALQGLAVEPLYPSLPQVAAHDAACHELFALVDVLRLGEQPQRQAARLLLRERLLAT
ncbi:hypothetical protein [Hymenobacter crusticola]|uniref:Uncharacterized protein n=1 Tax=Hymenobacter crusticola TaxID=1770526 RepID=A0A243WG91_9BACT|nr:hypothetical protein [Hymenobacter crusticola]OUJ74771.1 hypothetical protein BXP70_08415 [Hymenobacter crusticola]